MSALTMVPGAILSLVTAPGAKAAVVTLPGDTPSARMAQGTEVSCCRGFWRANLPLPALATAMPNQPAPRSNGAAPKSSVAMKYPFVTGTARFVRLPKSAMGRGIG
ncbi:MAG: hypothetical protein BWX84_00209 [Verrucomicrobia bacterium ADurb.Bin118]|nr:MAG: hypothetical protein BWX84_00209 [Verrucomicrobia bacterium ADurb.Bin118]